MTKSFTVARVDGRHHQCPYWPIKVTVGNVAHTFALHRDDNGHYKVSDIKSGACVLARVTGLYKGIACSTKGFTLAEIKILAEVQVTMLADRCGNAKFNAVVAAGKVREPAEEVAE